MSGPKLKILHPWKPRSVWLEAVAPPSLKTPNLRSNLLPNLIHEAKSTPAYAHARNHTVERGSSEAGPARYSGAKPPPPETGSRFAGSLQSPNEAPDR